MTPPHYFTPKEEHKSPSVNYVKYLGVFFTQEDKEMKEVHQSSPPSLKRGEHYEKTMGVI